MKYDKSYVTNLVGKNEILNEAICHIIIYKGSAIA